MRPRHLAILVVGFLGLTNPLAAQFSLQNSKDIDPTVGWQPRDLINFTDPKPNDTLYPVSVNNFWGYMNKQGNLVVYPQFDWADDFYEKLARATLNGKTGFIKGNGNWAIEPMFVYADRFAEGRAVVGDGEHFGYIEKSGNLFIPIRLDGALRFSEGLAAVMRDDKCGYVNLRGDLEIPLRFTLARSFHDGYAAVRWPATEGGTDVPGYVDRRGRPAFTDPSGKVQQLGDFHDGLARIRADDKWGYLGKNFKLRIDPRFDDARDFSNGVAAVCIDDKWGFIDKTGRFLVEPVFEAADDMGEDLAMVVLNGKTGYVNRSAKQGISPMFDEGRPFFQSLARVRIDPSFAYIDRNANPVWDPRLAVKGFINRSTSERIAIVRDKDLIHNRTIEPPAYRDPIPVPYTPEYLIDEVLPPAKP